MSEQLQADRDSAWNFFRRAQEPDLWCAVPINKSVPSFLLSGAWRFGGHRIRPAGFRADAAHHADALSGFYLFHHLS
jgi:hypothetical protein